MLVVILNCIEMAISVEFGRDETRADAVHTALLVSGNVFCALFGGTEYFWMPKKGQTRHQTYRTFRTVVINIDNLSVITPHFLGFSAELEFVSN
jgi:hypothetical protein